MEIEILLDLDLKRLTLYDEALAILENEYKLAGAPKDTAGLTAILARTLDRCDRCGIRWPRIFLARKGQLIRGEFRPRDPSATSAGLKFTTPTHPKIPQEWIDAAVEEERKKLSCDGKVS